MPVYPPSSTARFHLQLKTLLVPPQGAFSRRCLRCRSRLPLLIFFFPSLFALSLLPPPLPLLRPPLSFAGHAPFVEAPRARAPPRLAPLLPPSPSARIPRYSRVVWCRPAVSVRTMPRPCLAEIPQLVRVRSRRVRVKVYRGSPAAPSTPPPVYISAPISRDGQPSGGKRMPFPPCENAGLPSSYLDISAWDSKDSLAPIKPIYRPRLPAPLSLLWDGRHFSLSSLCGANI